VQKSVLLYENGLPAGTEVRFAQASVWDVYRWHIIAALVLCTMQTLLIVGLLIHRARRRKAERALKENRQILNTQQQLTGLLLRAQDEERRRIAHNLHDVTVQNLASIKADLTRAQRIDNVRAILTVKESLSLCDQVIKELRTLSYLLHPPLLDEAGLIPALQWFIRGFMQRSGIQVKIVVMQPIGRLESNVETALFRVAQESLTNVHRHSKSPTALIWVIKQRDEVLLRITDKGQGISEPGLATSQESVISSGIGILGMRQRLRQLGGRLEIQSSSRGTTVTARISLTGERHAAHSNC
jgi:signal transduction histidine kinase